MLCIITAICYHGNKGWSGVSLNDTVKLADTEKPLFGAKACMYLRMFNDAPCKLQLFKVSIGCNAIFFTFLGEKIGKIIFY